MHRTELQHFLPCSELHVVNARAKFSWRALLQYGPSTDALDTPTNEVPFLIAVGTLTGTLCLAAGFGFCGSPKISRLFPYVKIKFKSDYDTTVEVFLQNLLQVRHRTCHRQKKQRSLWHAASCCSLPPPRPDCRMQPGMPEPTNLATLSEWNIH